MSTLSPINDTVERAVKLMQDFYSLIKVKKEINVFFLPYGQENRKLYPETYKELTLVRNFKKYF